MFPNGGLSDDDARRKTTLPAFLEVTPSSFKSLADCTREEVEAQIISRTMQAGALVDEATALQRYLDGEIRLKN